MMEQILQWGIYALWIYIALINIIAAIFTAYDKHISRLPRGSVRRVPEKLFVRFSMLGGGIGTLSTMLWIRHKTKEHTALLLKIALWTVLWCVMLLFLLRLRH